MLNVRLLSDEWTFFAGQSGAPERMSSLSGFRISTPAEAESDSCIMIRDTLKTQKKRFWLGERTRTQEKQGNQGRLHAIPLSTSDPCKVFVTRQT